MDARFRGDEDGNNRGDDIFNAITCRMASSIMESYFDLLPVSISCVAVVLVISSFLMPCPLTLPRLQSDMRKLNRSDRPRADQLVLQGGRALTEHSRLRHMYEVALEHPPDEFFSATATTITTQLNGLQPILRLLRRWD